MPVFILLVVFVGMPIMLSIGLDDRTAIIMAITMLAGGVAYKIWGAHQIIKESEKELQNLSRWPQKSLERETGDRQHLPAKKQK
jgi:hypothetical protein